MERSENAANPREALLKALVKMKPFPPAPSLGFLNNPQSTFFASDATLSRSDPFKSIPSWPYVR